MLRRDLLKAMVAIAAAPAMAAEIKAPNVYLFSHFHKNGESGLHLAWSEDGLTWQALAGDRSFLKPELGGKLMRDPCILRGPDGRFHLVWSTGWKDRGFGYASSADLIRWSEQTWVGVNEKTDGANNTWAPDLYYDRKSEHFYIIWSTTIPGRFPETDKDGDHNHRMYFTKTRDFKTFTDAKLFYNPGFNCIDGTVIEVDGKPLLIFKDERLKQKRLRLAFADSIEGSWSAPTEPFTRDWVEGPSAIRVGEHWHIYFDHYTNPQFYGAVRTKDFKSFEDISEKLTFPPNPRHGTVFTVEPGILKKLQEA